ncbi:hypothetical protein ACLOJK_024909 [Asimina triloba]
MNCGIEKMAWDASGERLALSYQGSNEIYSGLVAVYDVRRMPLVSASLIAGAVAGAVHILFYFEHTFSLDKGSSLWQVLALRLNICSAAELLVLHFVKQADKMATKMFRFVKLSLACPWIQQQFERLTYLGIFESTLIFNSLKHFVDYYALPCLWVPRYPLQRVGDKRTQTADIRHRVNHRLSGLLD